jgi:hypothetical protein
MALPYYSFTAILNTDPDGDNIIAGQAVSVNIKGGGLASIYSDDAGTTPIAQPGAVTDSNGVLEFYANSGNYLITSGSRTEEIQLTNSGESFKNVTLAEMKAWSAPSVGDAFIVSDRANGIFDTVTVGTTSNVDLPNGQNIIVSIADPTKCFVLREDALPSVAQWGSFGGVTDETAIWQAIIDIGVRHAVVPYNATGYTINTLTNSSNTTFVFQGSSPMLGTQTLESLGLVLDSGYIGGAAIADDLRDGKIEIVSGTIRQEQPTSVAGITRSGTSGIVNEVAHGRVAGDWIVIQGASPTGYNGTHEIAQVDDVDTYRVVVDSGLTTPATGTITVFGADVWEWIKDGTHEPLGVDDSTPVRSDAGGYGLLIPFTKTYSKVLTMMVGPDETIAGAQAMVIGSSVSTSAIALRASINKTVAGRVLYDGANWAVNMGTDQGSIYTTDAPYPFDDIAYSGGNLTLNHSFCLGSDIRLTPSSAGGTTTPYIPVLKSNTDNETVVNFMYVNAGALALYTGAETTNMAFHYTKNSNRLIKFDGSDRSSETKMYFGNIWFFGIMQV